jgi:hypothetical protein
MTALEGWESFYVIVGSSAGALIGLQFVVITLIADKSTRVDAQSGGAFATPSVIHFAVVLLLSAILSAPWNGIATATVFWGLVGVAGVFYTVIVARRMRKQSAYRPVFEDWLFHVFLPLASYAMLAGSAWAAHSHPRAPLFFVAAASVLLLFIGIHNAWDAVTYHVYSKSKQEK